MLPKLSCWPSPCGWSGRRCRAQTHCVACILTGEGNWVPREDSVHSGSPADGCWGWDLSPALPLARIDGLSGCVCYPLGSFTSPAMLLTTPSPRESSHEVSGPKPKGRRRSGHICAQERGLGPRGQRARSPSQAGQRGWSRPPCFVAGQSRLPNTRVTQVLRGHGHLPDCRTAHPLGNHHARGHLCAHSPSTGLQTPSGQDSRENLFTDPSG